MIQFIKQLWAKVPAPLRAGLTTAVATFLGLFLPALLGWLQSLIDALATHGAMPSLSVVQQALVAGATAAITGFGNFLYRYVQAKFKIGTKIVYVKYKDETEPIDMGELQNINPNDPIARQPE